MCPPGFGQSSFRVAEALAVDTIPVYVWDRVPMLPYVVRPLRLVQQSLDAVSAECIIAARSVVSI